ncbi:MAG TPA: hypothetical protein VNR20_01995 [Terriglobales bacterium]|nr:hypothetical protein [Terriglobales bacterium]
MGRLLFQTTSQALVIGAVVTGASFTSAALQSRQTTAVVDVTKLGPQVGEKVPDFSLLDQHDQRRTLASLMGPKGLVLVFNRSADW